MLRDAAIALHRAKEDSATRCELFDVGMRDRAVSRLRVETDMRQAIERGAFEVYYQPIVSISRRHARRIRGARALASPDPGLDRSRRTSFRSPKTPK